MYSRSALPFPRPPASAARAVHAQKRLAFGLIASAALHLLWLALAHLPAFPRLPARTADPQRLTLTLAPTAPPGERRAVAVPPAPTPPGPVRPARTRPSMPAPAAGPRHAAAAAQRTPAATLPPAPVAEPAPPAAPSTSDPASTPEAPAGTPRPSGADILAAARQDAAAIARDLNHAPGSKTEFRSRAQEDLDRRFDAAHAAGGSWFRSARVEEITTAADGNRRVYRIITPLGAFCRTYYGDGKEPMNTTCPR